MQFARHIGRFPPIILMPSPFLRAAAALVVACLLAIGPARAAEPPPFTHAQLDQMLAPIALFPDALLSQVLMATTYPSDVALAVDWAFANRGLEGDAAVKAVQDKPWDPSVQSLVAFPQVLAMLGEKPEWVRDLGDAFLAQPGEVMDSVQFLRQKAKAAGNLASNEQQVVAVEPAPPPPQVIVVNAPPPPTQIITIAPANPQVVFVPIYNPVWAFGPWWHPGIPAVLLPAGPALGLGLELGGADRHLVGCRHRRVALAVGRRRLAPARRQHQRQPLEQHQRQPPDRLARPRRELAARRPQPPRRAVPRRRHARSPAAARRRRPYARRLPRPRRAARPCARGARQSRRLGTTSIAARCATSTAASCRSDPAPPTACATAPPASTAASSRIARRASIARRLQDRAGSVDRSQLQDRAAGVDRSQVAESRGERGPVAGPEPCRQRRSLAAAESRGQRRPIAAAEPQRQRRVHQSRQRAAQCRQCGADPPAGRPRQREPAGDAAAHVGRQRAASVGGRQRAAPLCRCGGPARRVGRGRCGGGAAAMIMGGTLHVRIDACALALGRCHAVCSPWRWRRCPPPRRSRFRRRRPRSRRWSTASRGTTTPKYASCSARSIAACCRSTAGSTRIARTSWPRGRRAIASIAAAADARLVLKDGWVLPIPIVRRGEGWVVRRARRRGRAAHPAHRPQRARRDQYDVRVPRRAARVRDAGSQRRRRPRVRAPSPEHAPASATACTGRPPTASRRARRARCSTPRDLKDGYHGYRFRILDAQGPAARGGARSYLSRGKLANGFALVAWPARYGETGVMSFLINHDGVVYQKNLGPATASIASAMTRFDPDATWAALPAP